MAVTSYKIAGTGADDATVGANAWSNPGNITADDTSEASWSVSTIHTNPSHYLKGTNAGFTTSDVPSGATIDGLEAEYRRREGSATDNVNTQDMKAVKAGSIIGTDVSTRNIAEWANSATEAGSENITEGGASNLWNTTWTDSNARDSTTGIVLSATANGTTPDAFVDYIRWRWYYTAGDVSVTPTGVAGTGAVGTPTIQIDVEVTPTGVAGTGAAGDVTVNLNTPVDVTGVAGTGAAGDVTVTGDANVTPTGVEGTGQVGSPTITTDVSVTPTGVEATGQAGDVTVSLSVDVTCNPTGVEGTGQVGDPTVTCDVSVTPTGVEATGQVGTVTVFLSTLYTVAIDATALAIATLTDKVMFKRSLDATALAVATNTLRSTFRRTLAATSTAIATIAAHTTYRAAISATVTCVATIADRLTYRTAINATAQGVAMISKKVKKLASVTAQCLPTITKKAKKVANATVVCLPTATERLIFGCVIDVTVLCVVDETETYHAAQPVYVKDLIQQLIPFKR